WSGHTRTASWRSLKTPSSDGGAAACIESCSLPSAISWGWDALPAARSVEYMNIRPSEAASMSTALAVRTRAMGAVRFEHVSRLYPNGPSFITALDAVTLEIAPGSFTAIMGPSGSGKSTFLNVAAG